MEQLTDDCQLLIIKYLKLEDQLVLWEATEHLSSRLNKNIIYEWQRKKDFVLYIDKLAKNLKHLNIILRSIGPTVQKLCLYNVTFLAIEHWRGHSFPNLQHLTYELDIDEENFAMELLVEFFPGLTSLCAMGSFASSVAGKWTQLRKLDTSDCYRELSASSFSQFQMLEEISFVDCWLSPLADLSSLLSLPRLQIMRIEKQNYTADLLECITRQRGLDIKQITFHDTIWIYDVAHLQSLKNLRQLALIEDDGFQLEQLQSLVSALPLLEKLLLINFPFFCKEFELWQTVALCPALMVLNISGMPLYADFFAHSRRLMLDVLDKRSSVLTLCCYGTGCDEDLMRKNFQHSKLKLTFEPLCKLDYKYANYYKIEFIPLRRDICK